MLFLGVLEKYILAYCPPNELGRGEAFEHNVMCTLFMHSHPAGKHNGQFHLARFTHTYYICDPHYGRLILKIAALVSLENTCGECKNMQICFLPSGMGFTDLSDYIIT